MNFILFFIFLKFLLIWEKIEAIPIVGKIVESRNKWFGHVRRRLVEVLVRRVDQIGDSPIARG